MKIQTKDSVDLEQPETSRWTVQPITASLHQSWHVEEKSYRIWGNLQFCCFFVFFLEIIYNKSHPSSLTKKQGALNGWHVLKLTSLVLNVLAVLKKFKQKIKCYLIHTLFITLTSTLSDNVLKSAWNVIDLPYRITFNKNLITRFLVETADFSLVTYAWLL